MVKPIAKLKGSMFSRAAGFARDRRAVAAVEFGMVLPFLALLAFGSVEVSDGIAVQRKLTHVTSTMGDLVAQSKVITNGDMNNIFNAASTIMQPFPQGTLKIIVSGITVGANSIPTVTWSDARNTDPLVQNSTYVLPPDLKVPNTFLVVADVSYVYTPTIAYVLTGDIEMKDHFYLKPRLVAKVCRPPQTANPCN